ncbi:glycosyltransferase family 2 protein [Pisolithus marmoratus]|nr:glycosyltransferase family 2 protein [Pisolithus marmoratus]
MTTRFAHPTFTTNDVPVPTTRPPLPMGTTIRRAKTLTRPERSVAPVPLINPTASLATNASGSISNGFLGTGVDAWRAFSRIVTFWAPSFLLSSFTGLRDKAKIQAWREKIALCFIISLLCCCVAFVTVGTEKLLCPDSSSTASYTLLGSVVGMLSIEGFMFNVSSARSPSGIDLIALAQQEPGQDITPYFTRSASDYTACNGLPFHVATDNPCSNITSCPLGPLNSSATLTGLNIQETSMLLGYDWDQIASLSNYFIIDGAVLNMNPYITQHPKPVASDNVDLAIRTVLSQPADSGKDATHLFYSRSDIQSAVPCLIQRYYAGSIAKITPGCFISSLFLYTGLIVILGLVLSRFAMACVFNWFISARLAGPPGNADLNRTVISPAVMPGGATISIDNRTGVAPWAGPGGAKKVLRSAKSARSTPLMSNTTLASPEPSQTITLAQIGAELFAVCLVTCYSEGEESLRTTLDSISLTTYSDRRKLLFVIADGMITGAGEKRSTPDICVSLLDADPRFGDPVPMSYLAIGAGAKCLNRAMVYAGHYTVAGRRTPTLVIVKCGTEAEASTDKKPGNRGKRDSQLILMNFFSRVTYNDRMTPLDFDIFRKIQALMGVTPDFFEVCLMVDADTKVYPDSLKYLVNCMHHDQMIMGVCGETRIANKRQSWVTAIQVFEYFISHHLAKAFESVFGGVTCLPGCFSMFRLKARRANGDDWVPLIIKPEIVREYSQSEVTTLHQKNLLLLGEDRFLTTILLRTFPNRKMMFLPQARCRTIVPDTFSVLLSQRRRWINSTVHNLMELILVPNLCGTFCFSMQFVVFMDLLGTVVLPIAIILTYLLVAGMVLQPPKTFQEAIPLLMLCSVLGLPALLILITTRKVVYVFWMFVYLLALPVWNFILPVYAFWHFDDFSWGETRKVAGETKGEGHDLGGSAFHAASVPLRRWEDWERSRLRKLKREERRRHETERLHPGGFLSSDNDLLSVRTGSQYDSSDTYSLTSSDDDHWGAQIGSYNESSTQIYPPPPVGPISIAHTGNEGRLVDGAELEAMLEAGFDDDSSPSPSRTPTLGPRYQLSDNSSHQHLSGNSSVLSAGPHNDPRIPVSSALNATGSSDDRARRRPAQTYGPLGPLDPGGYV